MAGIISQFMTVEEFGKLPEDQGPVYHELRHGEVFAVTRPKFKNHLIQSRLRDRLKSLAPAGALMESVVAFRALPEYELRASPTSLTSVRRELPGWIRTTI